MTQIKIDERLTSPDAWYLQTPKIVWWKRVLMRLGIIPDLRKEMMNAVLHISSYNKFMTDDRMKFYKSCNPKYWYGSHGK